MLIDLSFAIFNPKTKALLKEISRLHDSFLRPGGIIRDPSLCEVQMTLRDIPSIMKLLVLRKIPFDLQIKKLVLPMYLG
jgi:hypothetical protein